MPPTAWKSLLESTAVGATFTTAELQALLDEPLDSDNNAGRNLKKMEEAGLVDRVGDLWHRHDSPLWAFCDAWLTQLMHPEPANGDQESVSP